MQAWRHRWLQHLDSSGSIDMCDCPQPRAPFAPNRKDARHETCQARAARRNIEIACCHFDGDDRCERAKPLAVLDFAVEAIAHLSRVRRRKDAAMAKRTWSELKSALHPSDDAIGRQIVSDLIDERAVLAFLDEMTVFSCEPCQLRSINGWPPKRMIGQIAIGISKVNAVTIKRSANCASGISGRGRNEHALKSGFCEDTCVSYAV